ncbi:NirD/YgiW/YdeI family stress tolerance protein [Vibrio sp. SCSIO 43136]|uniref:YgiW/YdeI family stress tolerance OB fold protein n=1 Tax=Vibrio sp. SCSIO 43136 TaxID=2819101 RepID=UPI0020756BA5|nr:NirD/YgiW/YdeI family stress tolerance protein [Vibrio sp. SCSIO 43136]USD68284.1 NirD/YgiW/YdeI family stress tolerance protein [Vibrio sp. SCSIO 43136]
MKTLTTAIAIGLISLPTIALAGVKENRDNAIQYTGPVELSQVSELLQDTGMFTEKDVVVEGQLIRQINKDTYLFSDGVAEIQVELDDDVRLAQPLSAESKVRLFGEYEGGSTPEIEVDHVIIL